MRKAALLAMLPVLAFGHEPCLLASDGVIEINQAKALAGNVTAGDVGGFPVSINAAGSYILTSNLTVPLHTAAIQINAAAVTLDLGGFIVLGPNVCTGYPVSSCTVEGGTDGISSPAAGFMAVIRNGTVQGMSGFGITLAGDSSTVENVRLLSNGSGGIRLAGTGRVSRCHSLGNRTQGIYLTGGIAELNESRGNGDAAMVCAGSRGLLIGNLLFDNAVGALLGSTCIVSKNFAHGNAVNALPGFSTGDNVCGALAC